MAAVTVTGVLLRLQFSLIQIVLLNAPRKVYTIWQLKFFLFFFYSSLHNDSYFNCAKSVTLLSSLQNKTL